MNVAAPRKTNVRLYVILLIVALLAIASYFFIAEEGLSDEVYSTETEQQEERSVTPER